MPIFEYICKQCEHSFEALVYGNEQAECPKCHSRKLVPQLSTFAVSSKSLTSSYRSSAARRMKPACCFCSEFNGPSLSSSKMPVSATMELSGDRNSWLMFERNLDFS